VPTDSLRTLLSVLEVLRPAFTPAAFALFVVLFDGWVRTPGRHALTECLVATGVAGQRDHTAFYRFFSRGTWDPDGVGRCLFVALLAWLGDDLLALVIDDTLAHHKGPQVFGLGTHLDAVRSTRRTKVFAFGHVWVVLAVVVPVPFARRSFALPILFRLYRSTADCTRTGATYRKRTELAHDLVGVVLGWLAEVAPDRPLSLALDNGYTNTTVIGDLPAKVTVVGALRPDAALTCGGAAVSPAALAADATQPWQHVEAWLYGQLRTVEYKTLVAAWGRVRGAQPLRIVVVRCVNGTLPLRVFVCTEVLASARAVLEHYAGTRWPIEVTFRDLKQLLGLAQPAVRVEAAVLRIVPFIGLQYTLLTLWALHLGLTPTTVAATVRPWDRQPRAVTFGAILRTARKSLTAGDLAALATAHERATAAAGERLPYARPRLKRAA
jgi:hypothetical protein